MKASDYMRLADGSVYPVLDHPELTDAERAVLRAALHDSNYGNASSWGCLGVALVPIALVAAAAIWIWTHIPRTFATHALVLGGAAVLIGGIARLAKDTGHAKGAGRVLRDSYREPFLYIRPSSTDRGDTFRPDLIKKVEIDASPEIWMGALLKPWGPLVSLAGPTEHSTMQGAHQLARVSSSDWRTLVTAMMKVSQAVVVGIAAPNDNVVWELATLLEHKPLDRAILVLPPGTPVGAGEAFERELRTVLGRDTPVMDRTYAHRGERPLVFTWDRDQFRASNVIGTVRTRLREKLGHP